MNKTSLRDIDIVNAKLEISEDDLHSKVETVQSDTRLVEENPIIESSIPNIELDDLITYGIPEGHVALTFDDGPSKYSKELVNILKQYEVGATFFFVGSKAKKYPEVVRYVQSNGYSIGAHTMNHPPLPTLSSRKQEEEILQSIGTIEEITKDEVVIFRPPYGEMNDKTEGIIQENEKKLILWNNDPEDWKTKDANSIFNHVHDTETSGSIILFHESQAMIDALPKIIEYLQEQELKIVGLR